jgi:hypothetical protein
VAALVLAGVLTAVSTSSSSFADDEPASLTGEYSEYEQRAIDEAAKDLQTEVDPDPEGKVIERIVVRTLEPVEARDPVPTFLNAAHVTTRSFVVERDLLVKTGDRYRGVLVDESARLLRRHPQLSLVLCVALKGTTDDHVLLLVVTKDVWSLILDFDLQLANSGYDYILLEPKETNFLGTHQTLTGRLDLKPLSYSLGGAYQEPRLGGSWIGLLVDGNAIFNKETGSGEGSYGTLEITRPLASSKDNWAWFADVAWRSEITRHYSNGKLLLDGPDRDEHVTRRSLVEGAVTRSFGWARKNDVTLVFSMSRDTYRPVAPLHEGSSIRIPTSDSRVGPLVEWHAYTSDYLRTIDFDTLSLQEDFQLGYDVVARVYPVWRALGSSRDLLGFYGAVQHTVPLGSGIVRAAIESTTEVRLADGPTNPGCARACSISDGNVAAQVTIASPLAAVGRLLFGASVLNRYRNYLNATSDLGSDSNLRGYPTDFLRGDDSVSMNIELRTRPIEIFATHWGAIAFYDAGDAFDCFRGRDCANGFVLRSDAGVGLRMVWPEVERAAFRLDVAVPFNRTPTPDGRLPDAWQLSFGFGQAFGSETISGIGPRKGGEEPD